MEQYSNKSTGKIMFEEHVKWLTDNEEILEKEHKMWEENRIVPTFPSKDKDSTDENWRLLVHERYHKCTLTKYD